MSRSTRADWSASAPFRFAVGFEDTFVAHEYPGRRKLDEYELTQHYQFWESDLDLAAASGADSLRWGVPWYRVEPEPGRFAWDWVDRVVDRMSDLGLTCIVDLMHYGTPLWLSHTFLHPDYSRRVAHYAAAVASRYGDRLHTWTPLNEPTVNAIWCGERGAWPPHLTGPSGFVAVLMRLAEGICRTQAAVAAVQPDASFVHVDAGFRYEGTTAPLPMDVLLQRRFLALDLVTGAVDDAHPLTSWLTENGASTTQLDWLHDNRVRPDAVGVNYYPGFTTVRYDSDGTENPVEAGVAGLDDLIRCYAARYHTPVMITETSRHGTVAERQRWLSQSLACVAELRSSGIPVLGYTWFPFLALVDWLYRQADTPVDEWLLQMGLVDLVRTPGGGTLERRPTPLLDQFAEATRQGMPPVAAPATTEEDR